MSDIKETVVFDASALLALLNNESGAKQAKKYFPRVMMSTVNLSEVASCLQRKGIPEEKIKRTLDDLPCFPVPFEEDQIYLSAFLKQSTKEFGLSLGDRACIALGMATQKRVITADHAWKKLKLPISIELIR